MQTNINPEVDNTYILYYIYSYWQKPVVIDVVWSGLNELDDEIYTKILIKKKGSQKTVPPSNPELLKKLKFVNIYAV